MKFMVATLLTLAEEMLDHSLQCVFEVVFSEFGSFQRMTSLLQFTLHTHDAFGALEEFNFFRILSRRQLLKKSLSVD